jgi:hypothetical protein
MAFEFETVMNNFSLVISHLSEIDLVDSDELSEYSAIGIPDFLLPEQLEKEQLEESSELLFEVDLSKKIKQLQKQVDSVLDSNRNLILEQRQFFQSLNSQPNIESVTQKDFIPNFLGINPENQQSVKSQDIFLIPRLQEIPNLPTNSVVYTTEVINYEYGPKEKQKIEPIVIPISFGKIPTLNIGKSLEYSIRPILESYKIPNLEKIELPIILKYVESYDSNNLIKNILPTENLLSDVQSPQMELQINPVIPTLPKISEIDLPINYKQSQIELPVLNPLKLPIEIESLVENLPTKLESIDQSINFVNIQNPFLDKDYSINISSVLNKLPDLKLPNMEQISIPIIYDLTKKIETIKGEEIINTLKYEKIFDKTNPQVEKVIVPIEYKSIINELNKSSQETLTINKQKINIEEVTNSTLNVLKKTMVEGDEKINLIEDKINSVVELANINLKGLQIDFEKNSLSINNGLTSFLNDLYQINFDKREIIMEPSNFNLSNDFYSKSSLLSDSIKYIDSYIEPNTINDYIKYLDDSLKVNLSNYDSTVDMISSKSEMLNDSLEKINTNFNFDKIDSILKNNNPEIRVSTIDNKQFNNLIQSIENNSNIILQSLKQTQPKTEESNLSSLKFVKPQEEIKSNTDEKLLKVMSNLDEKMSLMITALSNISSWVNENRTSSPSLRPNKHLF